MNRPHLISTQILYAEYHLENDFVEALNNMGLIHIEVIEQTQYIHEDQIRNLEKIIRLYQELDLNLEGIDVVLNLLEQNQALNGEINKLKNKLRIYEPGTNF